MAQRVIYFDTLGRTYLIKVIGDTLSSIAFVQTGFDIRSNVRKVSMPYLAVRRRSECSTSMTGTTG